VVNAATAERDLAIIAVQGPNARTKAIDLIPAGLREQSLTLKSFFAAEQKDWFVSRTGYTGEDYLSRRCGPRPLCRGLRDGGVASCGLGARGTPCAWRPA